MTATPTVLDLKPRAWPRLNVAMALPPSVCVRLRLLLLLAAALPACATEAAEGIHRPWRAEREERGDTLVVRTIGGSVWRDTMRLVAELAIGELEGEDPYLFGSVRGLDVDAEGRIVVVDGQAREVRVFSPQGEHALTFGRVGDGPGEFRSPDHVRMTADGRIVVRDQPVRFSVFSAEGDYLGGWLLRSGFSTSTPFFLDADDRLLNPTIRDGLVLYDLNGTTLDTIDVPSRGYVAPWLEVTMATGRASYSIPFVRGEHWTVTRDGRFLVGLNDRYQFERWEPDGSVLRVEREADPVPVAPGEAAQAREQVTRTIRRANDPAWRWQGPDIPSTKPPYWSLLTGPDGTVWVLRSTPATEEENPDWDPQRSEVGFPTRWRAPVVADVFDEGGRYLGPVKFHQGVWLFPPPVLTSERIWALAIHELGHPQVVRFRLEPVGQQ